MQNLNYLMDHIMSQIFKIISSMLSKNNKYAKSMKIYVNQIESRIIFEIKKRVLSPTFSV